MSSSSSSESNDWVRNSLGKWSLKENSSAWDFDTMLNDNADLIAAQGNVSFYTPAPIYGSKSDGSVPYSNCDNNNDNNDNIYSSLDWA